MTNENIYNVWARKGNRFDPVLNVTVSQATAETLAKLLAHENRVPHDALQFVVSISAPRSFGFAPEPLPVEVDPVGDGVPGYNGVLSARPQPRR